MLFSVACFGKTRIGIRVRANSNYANGISTENFRTALWMHSYKHSKTYTLNPYILVEKQLYKEFSLQTGLGYNTEIYTFSFSGIPNSYAVWSSEATYRLSARYLSVPLLFTRPLKLYKNLSLLPAAGIENKFAISRKENYQSVFQEGIYIISDSYIRRYTLDASISIGVRGTFGSGSAIDVSIFGRRGLTKTFNGHFGFNQNLQAARTLYLGLSAVYSLSTR